MFNRSRISLVLALLISLVVTVPAIAGGWAVITLDELPTNVIAGDSLTVGFTVLQHGHTPMTDLSPVIVANLQKEEGFKVIAEPEGNPGHYTATLTFPKEGDWQWSIQAFGMDQKMPVLTVTAPMVTAADPPALNVEPVAPSISPLIVSSALVLALGLAGAVLSLRRRSRPVMALTVVCLLVGFGLLIAASGPASTVEAQAKSDTERVQAVEETSLSQVEFGRQLFIAKGCITCHVNRKAADPSDYLTVEIGATNLTNFSAVPEILFIRLKDPSAAKSDTKMPNLDLTEEEIEALIVFINSK